MSPEQISALTAIAAIFSKVGTWPIGSIIAATVFAPWIVMFLVSRSNEKRFEAALEMYKNNVKLVEGYEKMAGEQVEMIRISTSAMVELTSYLKNQVPCYMRMTERRGQ